MVATMEISFYICTVKSNERHDVAAESSVFCARNLLVKYSRIEWGRSNRPMVFAQKYQTARNAVFCMSN